MTTTVPMAGFVESLDARILNLELVYLVQMGATGPAFLTPGPIS